MAEKMEKDIKWMYDGPKSLVNREDYLLGKKIDKNFELFSDVVIKEKEETEERFTKTVLDTPRNAPTSSLEILGLDVVRTEDPLVAIRMQKEQRKRAILEDPLLKLKAQRILREAYEKEFGPKKHKAKKSKRKRSSSSLSSSSTNKPKKRERKENRKHKHKHRNRSPSPCSSGHHRNRHDHHRQHHSSRSARHDSGSKNQSETVDRVRNETSRERLESHKANDSASRPRMSREEMEAKRKAMMSNVQWRDEIRNKTIENATTKLRAEKQEIENAQRNDVAVLIGNVTTASSSVEQRLQSKKHTLQRSHNYMEKSFVRK